MITGERLEKNNEERLIMMTKIRSVKFGFLCWEHLFSNVFPYKESLRNISRQRWILPTFHALKPITRTKSVKVKTLMDFFEKAINVICATIRQLLDWLI